MSETKMRLRDNGPLVIEGPCVLRDADGNEFPIPADKPVVALCRCGASTRKPFCDGSHKAANFQSIERATKPDEPPTVQLG